MVEDIRCQWVGYTVELNCNPVYCQNSISFGDGQNYKWRGGRDLEKAQIIDHHRGRDIFMVFLRISERRNLEFGFHFQTNGQRSTLCSGIRLTLNAKGVKIAQEVEYEGKQGESKT